MNDLISRQAALNETWKYPLYTDPLNVLTEVRERIAALPSERPEPLTDIEMRIFLAAMAKERRVCEDVDKQFDGDKLTPVCNGIERKVKMALWGT